MSRRSQSAVSLSSLGRVSRSVDRDVGIGAASTITSTTTMTSRTIDYDRSTPSRSSTTSSGRLQSTPRPPLPTILSRRRYSLSSAAGDRITRDASPSTYFDAGGGGIDDDDGGYRRRRTPISWSRKDVVYTADGMRSVLNGTLAPGTNHTAATPRRSPSLSKYDYSATAAATAARNRSRRRLENDADDNADLSYVESSVDTAVDAIDEARRRARESRSRSRAASVSRVENTVASGVDARRRTHRAASVVYTASSASNNATTATNSNFLRTSSSDVALRRLSSRRFSLPATAAVVRTPYTAATARYYNGTAGLTTVPVFSATMPDGDGLDLTAFVLAPGEKFVPTDVRVSLLPSGKQAITYTRFSQKGHGDQTQANAEIERIIQRTRRMQDQMHTLETFVQRNRSLFPEDIIIYQHIIFYLLDEAELRRLGERRTDVEVYGVKIRERLVAPYGTDVASILKRYYSRYDEVDVEYTDTEEIRRRLRDEGVAEEAPSGGGGRRRYRTDVEEVETEETTGRRPNGRRPSPLDDDLLVVRRRPSSRDRSTSQGLYIDESLIGVDDLAAPGSRRRRSRQDAAPQFTARLHPKRIRVGDTMRLNCSVTGEPEPKVTWYYGKEQIHNDRYYNISNTFGLCSLKVLSVAKNDSGSYTARATNHLGEVSTSADIIVEDDEETVAADAERGTRKPWFVVDARNTYAEAGQRAVFEAQAIGTPPPTFKWKKDNVDVMLDNRVRVVSDDLGNTKLVIRDVRSTDAGVYFCIAENSVGKAKCAATLRVINADETDHRAPVDNDSFLLNNKQSTVYQFDDDVMMSRGRWPQFVQTPPLHIDVYEGDPLTLRCVVEGDPSPVVTWYKGVRELTYSERHRVIAEGEGSHLMQIKSTLQTDPGEYTAVATNSCGHSKFTTVVNVLPRPRQDDDQQTSKPKPVEREFELVKRMEQGKMPPIFIIKLPREKTIKLGQTLLFDCHIEEAKMRQYLVGVDIVVKDKPDLHPDVKITSTAPDEQLQQQITSEQPVSA